MKIIENEKTKIISSENYNFVFNKSNGMMMRWGKDKNDDPDFSPFGPEILDLEISSSIHTEDPLFEKYKDRLVYDGGCKGRCSFCYKSNGNYPTYNMTIDEFKTIFHKIANTVVLDKETKEEFVYDFRIHESYLTNKNYCVFNKGPFTQIAFGIMNIDTNPDFYAMAEYCRKFGVAPNFTMHGLDDIDDKNIDYIVKTFGACAISVYNKEKSYNLIERLTNAGMKQVNIHLMYCNERKDFVYEVLNDTLNDDRLKNLNAVVLLGLKTKGRGVNFTKLDDSEFDKLVKYIFDNNIKVGFDSCTANKFINAVKKFKTGKELQAIIECAEPCESMSFSSYINCFGEFYPCSFCEGAKTPNDDWSVGISVLNSDSFMNDVWNSDRCFKWRECLKQSCRSCPIYNV